MAMRRPPSARVQPVPEAVDKAREAMKSLPHNAVNVRATMAHHPVLNRAFGGFANAVLTECSTPRRQRELVILRMGWNCQAVYEFGQHTMYGMAHGVTAEEVAAVTRPLVMHPWADDDRVLLQMVDDLHADDCVSDATWSELSDRWSTPEIFEFVMAALCYRVVSGFLNTCGVELDDGVPGWPA
ncbi:MAG: carboxymuconolactone decarboxylase family protein [Acidimicrobiia bacterium]|nr:carboxymuconolactone decarboxylase family protein [Acidimicrobiia bacterium]